MSKSNLSPASLDEAGGANVLVRSSDRGWVLVLFVLLAAELALISLAYKNAFVFECRAAAPVVVCAALGEGVIRAMAVLGAGIVFFLSQGAAFSRLLAGMRISRPWLMAQVAGAALIMLPWFFLADGASALVLGLALLLWLAGLILAGLGTGLALFEARAWGAVARAAGWPLLAIGIVAALAPEIAAAFQAIWHWPAITNATFDASAALLSLWGEEVTSDPETLALGLGEFAVLVGQQCSGVEGFALITSFLLLYIWLFRDRLAFPAVLILLPIGVAVSWGFNAIRIAALISIGAKIDPDLAINGFHSHAGWLLFTVLATGLAVMVHKFGWFARPAAVAAAMPADKLPLAQDWAAARILPFIVFMASALLSQTFAQEPAILYPARAIAMAAILWLFRVQIAGLIWRLDWVALAVGALIGAIWIGAEALWGMPDPGLATALAALGPGMLAIWIVTRIIGTVVCVPLIEELFFRGYVMTRLAAAGQNRALMLALGVGISTLLFAALHGRVVLAGLAGLAFAGLMLWRDGIPRTGAPEGWDGRSGPGLSAAVQAHAAANALIALAALYLQDWSLL